MKEKYIMGFDHRGENQFSEETGFWENEEKDF